MLGVSHPSVLADGLAGWWQSHSCPPTTHREGLWSHTGHLDEVAGRRPRPLRLDLGRSNLHQRQHLCCNDLGIQPCHLQGQETTAPVRRQSSATLLRAASRLSTPRPHSNHESSGQEPSRHSTAHTVYSAAQPQKQPLVLMHCNATASTPASTCPDHEHPPPSPSVHAWHKLRPPPHTHPASTAKLLSHKQSPQHTPQGPRWAPAAAPAAAAPLPQACTAAAAGTGAAGPACRQQPAGPQPAGGRKPGLFRNARFGVLAFFRISDRDDDVCGANTISPRLSFRVQYPTADIVQGPMTDGIQAPAV